MIKPGEYRFIIDNLDQIVYASDRIAYVFQDCREIASSIDVQPNDFRYKQMVAGFKLTQKSYYDSANIYSIFYLQLIITMTTLIKKQYGITLDQLLEEQYIDFSSLIYSKLPEFAKLNLTERLGTKRATWAEIETKINEIQLAKYSGVRMTWDFIGAKNDH